MQVKSQNALFVLVLSLSILTALEFLSFQLSNKYYLNFTSSLPVGIYQKINTKKVSKGDLVLFKVPDKLKILKEARSWLRHKKLLMKPIMAIANDTFCIKKQKLYINQEPIAKVKSFDSDGLNLPRIRGCHRLLNNEFLPISLYSQNSFDGRYFGALSLKSIVAVVKPVFVFT